LWQNGYTLGVNPNASYTSRFHYPRRRAVRFVLRRLIRAAFALLADFRVVGKENLPKLGPLIVVANHFHFTDPVAVIGATAWPLDFLGGFHLIDTPPALAWIPKMWGYYTVRRGAASRNAMRASMAVLAQKGVLGIFPEGGSWAPVLRPARPGTAYLALQTGAPILPIGLDGLIDLFPALRRGRRATVTVRVGEVFGPFHWDVDGRPRREQLDALGDEIMQHIAEVIPPERHGVYSSDPQLRKAAEAVAAYPYDDLN
jgi:1-acyl-sn-glycerol-3-phosphate acyltransferase